MILERYRPNLEISQRTEVTDEIYMVKRLKWNWAGHVARRCITDALHKYLNSDQGKMLSEVAGDHNGLTIYVDLVLLFGNWVQAAQDCGLWETSG